MVAGRGSVSFFHRALGVVILPLAATANSHVTHVAHIAHIGPTRTIPKALLLLHLELTLIR